MVGWGWGDYVAGSSCSTTVAVDRFVDCIDDDGVTRHAEVIVGSPNTNPFGRILGMRIRKFPSNLN